MKTKKTMTTVTTDKNEAQFLLSAKKLFLTWPQCDLELENVLTQLRLAAGAYNLIEYLIVKETGADGEHPHIHAFVKFEKKFNTKNPHYLDLKNGAGEAVHGRYETARSESASVGYLLKDINRNDEADNAKYIMSDGLARQIDGLGETQKIERNMIALARNGLIDEALRMYEERYPAKYVHTHDKLRASLKSLAILSLGMARHKFRLTDFVYAPWMLRLMEAIKDRKTVVLYGPSGYGKTQFILTFITEALGLNPLVINNLDSIRNFKNDVHSAIVFDDCGGWDEKPLKDIIKLVDSEVPTTHGVKHGSTAIEKAVPRFLLGNPPVPDVFSLRKKEHDPIHRRIAIIVLNSDSPALFKQSPEQKEGYKLAPTIVDASDVQVEPEVLSIELLESRFKDDLKSKDNHKTKSKIKK